MSAMKKEGMIYEQNLTCIWAKMPVYQDCMGSQVTRKKPHKLMHIGNFMRMKREVANLSMYCTVWNKIVKGWHVIFWNEKNGISDKSLWDPLGWKMAHSGRMHSICCIIIIFLIVQRNKMYFACHPVPQISIPS